VRDIRDGICPSCNHDEIIEAFPYERGPVGFEALAVTHERVTILGSGGFDPQRPRGRLRVYVCRRCGLTQWFADRPDEIPVDEDHMTRLIKGDRGGPYR
jgi:hypothetical protein